MNAEGRTQLYIATRDGNLAEVNRLLALGTNVNKATNSGVTPLYMASYKGHLPIVERLLAAPGIDVNKTRGDDGVGPLFIASQEGHRSIVERLLAVPGIDINKATNNGITPCSQCRYGCWRSRSGTRRRQTPHYAFQTSLSP